jgi:hypothetical protein
MRAWCTVVSCGGLGLLLWLQNLNNVRQADLGALDTLWVIRQHNLDSNTHDTLTHHNVTSGIVLEDDSTVTRLHHVTITELHGLGSLTTQLAGNYNLNTLGARLHGSADNTVAGSSHWQGSQKLVLEGVSLCLGGQTAVSYSLGEQLNLALHRVESLGQL